MHHPHSVHDSSERVLLTGQLLGSLWTGHSGACMSHQFCWHYSRMSPSGSSVLGGSVLLEMTKLLLMLLISKSMVELKPNKNDCIRDPCACSKWSQFAHISIAVSYSQDKEVLHWDFWPQVQQAWAQVIVQFSAQAFCQRQLKMSLPQWQETDSYSVLQHCFLMPRKRQGK